MMPHARSPVSWGAVLSFAKRCYTKAMERLTIAEAFLLGRTKPGLRFSPFGGKDNKTLLLAGFLDLELAGDYERQLLSDGEATTLENLKKAGMEVTEPNLDEFRDAAQKVYGNYSDKFTDGLLDSILEQVK